MSHGSRLRTVLVATDRSPGARIAVERGRHLTRTMGLDLVVCHVMDEHDTDDGSVLVELSAENPDARVMVRRGHAFVEIVRTAREVDAVMIVAGAFGEHRSGRIPLGVTIDRLVRKADRPVLVSRIASRRVYRTVVAGIDGSVEGSAGLGLARSLAPDAHLIAVRAFEPVGLHRLTMRGAEQDEIERYRATFASTTRDELARDLHGVDATRIVAEGRPEAVLASAVASHGADLLAVGWRGANPVSHVLLGSVAHHSVHEVRCDVLVYRTAGAALDLP